MKQILSSKILAITFFYFSFLFCELLLDQGTFAQEKIDLTDTINRSVKVGFIEEKTLFEDQRSVVKNYEGFVYGFVPKFVNENLRSILEDVLEKDLNLRGQPAEVVVISWGFPDNMRVAILQKGENVLRYSKQIPLPTSPQFGLYLSRIDFGFSFKNEKEPSSKFLHFIVSKTKPSDAKIEPEISFERRSRSLPLVGVWIASREVVQRVLIWVAGATVFNFVVKPVLVATLKDLLDTSDKEPPRIFFDPIESPVRGKPKTYDVMFSLKVEDPEPNNLFGQPSGLDVVLVSSSNIPSIRDFLTTYDPPKGARKYENTYKIQLREGSYSVNVKARDLSGNQNLDFPRHLKIPR